MAFQQFPAKGGIPSGTTAARPTSPVTGDTYYDGDLGFLLIWDGDKFLPCSAPAAQPSIAVTDVGTSVAYGTVQGSVAFTEGVSGGKAAGFTAVQGSTSFTSTSTPIVLTITGNPGSYSFTGTAFNGFGTSPEALSVSQTLTSVPQTPTIGTATTSSTTTDVVVAWTLGANGGKNLSSITITPFLDGTTAQTATTAATTSSTSATIVGLTQGSSYTFKVKATNANGTSLDSSATGSITVPTLFTVDYLVIAGGGGGGGGYGGGGGAGGYRTSAGTSGAGSSAEPSLSRSIGTNFTVTVGAGGAGGIGVSQTDASVGVNSVFDTITSTGGGKGRGATNPGVASTGGSGGGNNVVGQTFAGTANQGTAGGTATGSAPNYGNGGGGGASTSGSNGTTTTGGAGGSGLSSDITGSSLTRGGGGGGGTYQGGTGGSGGSGGGGNAGQRVNTTVGQNGFAGTVNTGGGGGSAASGTEGYIRDGGAGGSGVVILRYPDTRTITIGAGLTGTESSASGGFKRATITAGSGNVSWA